MTLPLGKPPIPRAISRPREPVEYTSIFASISFFPSIIMEPFPYDFSILLITDLSLFKFSFLSI